MPPHRFRIFDLLGGRLDPTSHRSQNHANQTPARPTPRKPATPKPPLARPTPHTIPLPATHASTHEALAAKIQITINRSLAKGTAANYAYARRTFEGFCSTHNLVPWPAEEFTLCAFAASLASTMAGSSIASLLAGVRSFHTSQNMPWNGSDRLHVVVRGALAMSPYSSARPKRAPVTEEMLVLLHQKLDPKSPLDIAVGAAASTSYWGQCRLGEVLTDSSSQYDRTRVPSRKDIGPSVSRRGSREIHLPRTKTHQLNGDTVLITAQKGRADPISALEAHLSGSKSIPDSFHLFGYIDPATGRILALTREKFLRRCNEIWRQAGFWKVTGHAFRIGGTTGLLKAGVAPEVVRTMGRWASDAHFRYWRDTRDIVLKHAEMLGSRNAAARGTSRPPLPATAPNATHRGHRLQGDRITTARRC